MPKVAETTKKSRSATNTTANTEDKVVIENTISPKRGRNRSKPTDGGVLEKQPIKKNEKTKIVNGRLMVRAPGLPKKISTGKPGRPRKEYTWIDSGEAVQE